MGKNAIQAIQPWLLVRKNRNPETDPRRLGWGSGVLARERVLRTEWIEVE